MSTKAIRELIEAHRKLPLSAKAKSRGLPLAALEEVEAIEKAAGPAWCALDESVRQIHRLECAPEPVMTQAMETMAAIARQKEEAK